MDGEVIEQIPPKDAHQRLVEFLDRLLGLFVEISALGLVRLAPFELRLWPEGPARQPDLMFLAAIHRHRLTTERSAARCAAPCHYGLWDRPVATRTQLSPAYPDERSALGRVRRGTAAVGVACQVKQGIGVHKPATCSLECLRCPERPPATIKKLR
ncbi:MAG: hypothetical protein C4345_15165 [Chloroflexota bacterium]